MPDPDFDRALRPRARPAPPGAPPPCGPRARAAPAALALALALACGAGAHAAPEGGKVRQGDADIDRDDDASTTTITQRSRSAVIDWRSFDVARGETVNFAQPDAASLTVNAIHDVRPTEVLGRISANGRVALLNPHGVIFGRHSVIDVGALIAGSAKFERIDERGRIYTSVGEANSVLINGGLIQASQSVALVGTHLENSGTILARLGSVQLASGRMRTIDFDGYGLIHLGLAPAIEGSLDLSGASRVEANTIAISVSQASRIIDSLVNVDGVLRADTVGIREGQIALLASNQGVGFSAAADAGEGGAIDILSDGAITVGPAASLSAPAGRVRIGGSYQGRDRALMHSASTAVRRGARIDVSAGDGLGAGGEAVVWSDGATDFRGHIRAMGEGGSIEVSGKELGIGEAARFDLSPSGSLLLDPDAVTIGTGGAACVGTGGSTIPTDTADCTIAPSVLEAVGSGTVTVLADDSITVSGDVDMNPAASLTLRTAGSDSTDSIYVYADIDGGQDLTIETGGPLSGTGELSASNAISLMASGIGSSTAPLTLDGGGSLALRTSGSESAGDIYVSLRRIPASIGTPVTDAGSGQAIQMLRTIFGSVNVAGLGGTFPSLAAQPGDSLTLGYDVNGNVNIDADIALSPGAAPVLLRATGSITGSAAVSASYLRLQAASIGASASRLAANASGTLSLETTGAGGNIFIGATELPETELAVSTDTATEQTVDLNFDVTGDAAAPATLTVGAGDTVALRINATAGGGMDGDITVSSALTASVISLGAAGSISVSSVLTAGRNIDMGAIGSISVSGALTAAEGLTLNTTGPISGSGVMTAGEISLFASGIGSSTAPVRLTFDDDLTLATTGTGSAGDIYVSHLGIPPSSSIDGVFTDAGSGQTIQFLHEISGDVDTAGLGALPLVLASSDDSLLLGYDVAGNVDIDADIAPRSEASYVLLLRATGSITGSAAVSASNLRLEAASIGASANRLAANASATLSLATTGAGGNIYIGSTMLPATALTIRTDASSEQTVDLDFDITGDAAAPATLTVGAGDTVSLDIAATAGGGMDGDIAVGAAVNLEPSAATASALTLNAAGVISGSGTLTADDITLAAVGAIGASADSRLAANAVDSLSLATTGAGGNIFLGGSWPLLLTMATEAGTQTVDLSFNTSGTLAMVSIAPHSSDTLSFSLTATGVGAGITGGTITADTINLTAAGAIGASAASRLAANASGTLSLETTGAGGNIFIGATELPETELAVSTDTATEQTVDLDFDITGDAAAPAALSIAAGDAVSLDIAATAGGGMDGDIAVGAAVNLEPSAATASALTLNAAGAISGSGALTADAITLTAVGAIGTGADSRLAANAVDSLSLTTTGAGGNIFLGGSWPLLLTMATGAGTQTVDLSFSTSGTLAMVNIAPHSSDILSFSLTATGVGAGISGGAITADTISLTAVGPIGASAASRLAANASSALSLATTGAGGDIFIAANALPSTALAVSTDAATAQTVDLDFGITGDAAAPATLTVGAGDTVTLGIAAAAGGGAVGDIAVGAAVDLGGAATSALALRAAGSISGPGAMTADAITLTATGSITGIGAMTASAITMMAGGSISGSGALTAGAITLTAAGAIGASAASRLAANASSALSLATTGAGGDIFIAANALPSTELAVSTDAATAQTVDLDFDITGDAAAPATLTVGAGDTVTLGIAAAAGGGAVGDIAVGAAVDLGGAATSALALRAAGSISGSGALTAGAITLTAAGAIGASAASRLAANASSALSLATTGAGGDIFIAANALPSTELAVSTDAATAQTVDLDFDITGDAAAPATLTVGAGDTVTLGIAAAAGGGMDGDIAVGAAVDLGGAATSALDLRAAGAISGPGALTAGTINIEARRVGPGSDTVIAATLEGDSDVARLRVAARTLNINSGAVGAGGAGAPSPAEHIYISLQGDLASGTLAASGRLSIDPNGHSVGAVRQSEGSGPVPGNPLGFSDGGPGVNEAVESALVASQGDLVDFRARRLYIGAPTGIPATTGGARISTDSISLDIDPLDEGAPLPSVSMRYRPAAGAEAVLRLEYVNSVRDFVLSAEQGAAPSRLVVGEVGLYGDSQLRGGIQDTALHNFASLHNGYGVQAGGAATLLASDDATLDGIGRYQVAPNQAAVANFNVRQLFLYTAPGAADGDSTVGSSDSPLFLDRRQGSALALVGGDSGTFFLAGASDTALTGSTLSRNVGSVAGLRSAGIFVSLTGEAGQINVVTVVSSFRAANDLSLFLDTSVFLSFDLVVYSEDSNATCSAYTFEGPGEGQPDVEGCPS